jgi:sugar phosphate isomerase/epimerase
MVWEFKPGFMFNKPSQVAQMLEDVGHPNFSILFDTCHAHMCSVVAARQPEPNETLPGAPAEFAMLLKGKIGHVHIIDSDNTLHNEDTSTNAPFGTGVLNFHEIILPILEAGYDSDWWSIELCFWPEARDVTAEATRFVDGLRDKYRA